MHLFEFLFFKNSFSTTHFFNKILFKKCFEEKTNLNFWCVVRAYMRDQFVSGTGRIFAEQGTMIGKPDEDQRSPMAVSSVY